MHPLSAGRSADVVQRGLGTKKNPVSAVTYLKSYVRLFIDAGKPEPLVESANGAQQIGAKGHVAAFHAIDETLRFERGIAGGKTNDRVYARSGRGSRFASDVGPQLNGPPAGSAYRRIRIGAGVMKDKIASGYFHVVIQKE